MYYSHTKRMKQGNIIEYKTYLTLSTYRIYNLELAVNASMIKKKKKNIVDFQSKLINNQLKLKLHLVNIKIKILEHRGNCLNLEIKLILAK